MKGIKMTIKFSEEIIDELKEMTGATTNAELATFLKLYFKMGFSEQCRGEDINEYVKFEIEEFDDSKKN